jgi:PKD repeat protein
MNTAATLNHSDTVVVPANAVLNTPLRMRIGSDRSTNPLPNGCNNLLNGQYEDYTIVITPNTLPPVAAAAVDSVSLCSGFVSFTDLSTFNPTSWLWSFGDSNTSTLQNPTHTYSAPGTYTVTLIATNAFGSDTTTLSVTVNTLNATMLVTGWLQIGQQVQFTGSPTGATSYLWDFGDGFLSTLQNPTHSYSAAGSYPVSLTVTLGNCTATVVDTVVILLVGIAETDPQNSLLLLPNPYSESLTIQFYNNGREPVTLSVTDALGKVVTKFMEEQILEAGTHTYRFRHHAPGVYMVIFKSGEHTITEKVIQLK